jgi:hypothetical protein
VRRETFATIGLYALCVLMAATLVTILVGGYLYVKADAREHSKPVRTVSECTAAHGHIERRNGATVCVR